MIQMRVSDLDAWLAYAEPEREEREWSTEQLIARLTKADERSDDMLAGSALHALLERAEEGEMGAVEGVVQDGFAFHFDGDFEIALPSIREPEVIEHTFVTPSGRVLLRGRIDGRYRIGTVVDYKLSKWFDAERYARSLQWRSYLMLTGAPRFLYRVFECNRRKRDVFIYAIHDLDFWPYPEIGADVHRRVCELAEFIVSHVPDRVAGPVEAMAADAKRLAGRP